MKQIVLPLVVPKKTSKEHKNHTWQGENWIGKPENGELFQVSTRGWATKAPFAPIKFSKFSEYEISINFIIINYSYFSTDTHFVVCR